MVLSRKTLLTVLAAIAFGALGPFGPGSARAAERFRAPRMPAQERWLDPVLPPMPAEGEALEAVWDRFPDIRPEEVIPFLRENFSREIREFRRLADLDGRRAVNVLTDAVQEAVKLMDLKRRDAPQFDLMMRKKKLEDEAVRQANRLRNAKGEEKDALDRALRGTLTQIFDIKHDLMKRDVEQMSSELDRLRKLIQMREENREAIIERHLVDLSKEMDFMEW